MNYHVAMLGIVRGRNYVSEGSGIAAHNVARPGSEDKQTA